MKDLSCNISQVLDKLYQDWITINMRTYRSHYLKNKETKPYSYLSSIAEQINDNITSSRNIPRDASNLYKPFNTYAFRTTREKQKSFFETITPYVEPDTVTTAKVVYWFDV
jgi:type III secretory pathway component EscR